MSPKPPAVAACLPPSDVESMLRAFEQRFATWDQRWERIEPVLEEHATWRSWVHVGKGVVIGLGAAWVVATAVGAHQGVGLRHDLIVKEAQGSPAPAPRP